MAVDPRSGFCASTGIYHSLQPSVCLPSDPFLTLLAYIFHRPNFDPNPIAFIDSHTGESLSYGDLRSRIYSAAAGLSRFGVSPGDVVLILSPNSFHFSVLMFAVMAVGAIVTTTNPLNHPNEIAKQAADSKASFVAALPSLLPKLQALPVPLPLILLPDSEGNPPPPPPPASQRFIAFPDLLASHPRHFSFYRGRQDDTAALLYSSGTTGTSKGVILTHRNFIAQMALFFSGSVNDGEIPWNKRVYMCLIPMFHVYGMAFFGCGTLITGATTVLQQKFDLLEMLAAVQKYRITHLPVVPPVLVAIAKLPIVDKFDLSSLVQVGSGAGPLSKEVIDAFRARFPNVQIGQGYGLTESTAIAANSRTPEDMERFGSTGKIAPNTEMKIVDIDTGLPQPPSQRGEIWIRGPTIMKGYFGRPNETAATIDSEGWLHTGDVGYIDEEGYLYVVDRLKELIKYKGLQVAPAELEAVLLSHREIIDAAVIPYPDLEAGQIPMAFIVKDPKSKLTEGDVMEFVAGQVAPYKKVRRVSFIASIPKSVSGKILRRELVALSLPKSRL